MSRKITKYINYVKEAFLLPTHLIGLAATSIVTVVAMLIMGIGFGLNPFALLLVLGGLEFMYLGTMSRNDRFIRATNAKYQKEIQAFHKNKAITDYYNELSAPRQRRFEFFKTKLDDIRTNYEKLHGHYPSIVNGFLTKIGNLQLSFVKLLFMEDKLPDYLDRDNPDEIRKQIAALEKSMEKDSGKLQDIKKKRIRLMGKRIEAYKRAKENSEIVKAQLMTIEEMVNYIKDQPMALKSTETEDMMIDNILFETEQMQDTIADIESIMSTDFRVGSYGGEAGETGAYGLDAVAE